MAVLYHFDWSVKSYKKAAAKYIDSVNNSEDKTEAQIKLREEYIEALSLSEDEIKWKVDVLWTSVINTVLQLGYKNGISVSTLEDLSNNMGLSKVVEVSPGYENENEPSILYVAEAFGEKKLGHVYVNKVQSSRPLDFFLVEQEVLQEKLKTSLKLPYEVFKRKKVGEKGYVKPKVYHNEAKNMMKRYAKQGVQKSLKQVKEEMSRHCESLKPVKNGSYNDYIRKIIRRGDILKGLTDDIDEEELNRVSRYIVSMRFNIDVDLKKIKTWNAFIFLTSINKKMYPQWWEYQDSKDIDIYQYSGTDVVLGMDFAVIDQENPLSRARREEEKLGPQIKHPMPSATKTGGPGRPRRQPTMSYALMVKCIRRSLRRVDYSARYMNDKLKQGKQFRGDCLSITMFNFYRNVMMTAKRSLFKRNKLFSFEQAHKLQISFQLAFQDFPTYNDQVRLEIMTCNSKTYASDEVVLFINQLMAFEGIRFNCVYKPALKNYDLINRVHTEEPLNC
jgi:hypothetical protein